MRAVDTNVLVRLVTRDDERQVASAEAFIAKGDLHGCVELPLGAEPSGLADSLRQHRHRVRR